MKNALTRFDGWCWGLRLGTINVTLWVSCLQSHCHVFARYSPSSEFARQSEYRRLTILEPIPPEFYGDEHERDNALVELMSRAAMIFHAKKHQGLVIDNRSVYSEREH